VADFIVHHEARVSGPKSRTDHIAALWESRIPDIDTFKQRMQGSVLVAIDVESSARGVQEIGLATLRIGVDGPQFSRNLQFFYDQNEIKATTIQGYRREMNRSGSDRYGDTVFVEDANEDTSSAVEKVLSHYQGQNLILVGFDMYTELEWISNMSEMYTSLASLFTAWVDLEELTLQRCESENPHINLTATVKAMQIEDSRAGNYFPANDAVRCLAVLSGLASTILSVLAIESYTLPSGITLLYNIPRPRMYGPHTKYPFSALVTTIDGNVLPTEYETTHSVAKLSTKYDLEAVGLNCQKYGVGPTGVKFWWLAFPTREFLDRFTLEVHGSIVNGKELRVV
jgi:hypothetical protein